MPNQERHDNGEMENPPAPYSNILDSRTSHLHDALNAKLEQALHGQTMQVLLHDVAKIADEHDPIDLAYAVTRLPPNARIIVYENLPDLQAKAKFMIHTGRNTRFAIFKQIDDQAIKKLIETMPPDEAVWLLDDMSDRRSKRLLEILEPAKAAHIRELQKHDRHSAGRHMTNEFFSFHYNTTIGEVAKYIRDNPGIELTRCIFVLNDDNELVGYVPGRNLIVNPHYLPIRQVMRPILHKVTADASRDEVVDIVERYQIPALPVVDEHDHIVGVITYEDVVEAMEDIADETIAAFAGTGENISEHESITQRFLWRLPWLVVTLCAGLITATAMQYFSGNPWFLIVPFFVPLMSGLSGNVGIQCSTVLVRGMSTGEISSGTKGIAIRSELAIGLLIGSTFGVCCGIIVYLLNHFEMIKANGAILGLTVSCGVFAACMTATSLGAFLPFGFTKLKIDPAVAAGPMVTAFNDVVSTFMFFMVARLIYTIFTP